MCAACGAPLAPAANVAAPANDDRLPDWLQQLQSGQLQGAAPAYQPQGAAAPYQYGGAFAAPPQQPYGFGAPPQQFSAGSLVSDDALPEWLRGAGQAPAPQGPPAPATWNSGGGPAIEEWGPAPGAYAQPYGAPPVQGQDMHYGSMQPAPRTSGPINYGQPASGLFDESALPDWLREASRGQSIDPGPQLPYVQPPAQGASSAFPSIDQVGMHQPVQPAPDAAGLSGRALLDTGALPEWLSGQPGGAGPSARVSNPGGMAAQSLIDESALPQWLRAEPHTAAVPAPGIPAPLAQPPSVSNRLASSAAAEPLPAWLNQVYADANVARVEPPPAPAPWGMAPVPSPAAPLASGQSPMHSAGGMSAADFVDESALPEWLKSQGAMETPAAAAPQAPFASPYAGPSPADRVAPQYVPADGTWGGSSRLAGSGQLDQDPPVQRSPSGHFSASDLIDPSALPSWVKGEAAPPPPSFSSTSGWTSRQPAAPISAGGQSSTLEPRGPEVAPPSTWGSAELDWEDGPGFGQAESPTFQNGRDPRFSGPLALDANDEPDMYRPGPQPGPRNARRGQAPYPQAGRGPDPRFGERAPNTDRRRGPPIPQHELPPWLQRGGQAPGMQGGPGYGPMAHGGRPMGPAGGYEEDDWAGMPQGGEQWENWDDGQPGGSGYDVGYDGYSQVRPDQRGQPRSGWRRFFGRK